MLGILGLQLLEKAWVVFLNLLGMMSYGKATSGSLVLSFGDLF